MCQNMQYEKNMFSMALLNTDTSVVFLIAAGTAFHVRAPATEKAISEFWSGVRCQTRPDMSDLPNVEIQRIELRDRVRMEPGLLGSETNHSVFMKY